MFYTAYQLQFGPEVTAYPDSPGKITLTWLNTYLFRYENNTVVRGTTPTMMSDDSPVASYRIYMKGKDKQDVLRVNISYEFEAPRVNSKCYDVYLNSVNFSGTNRFIASLYNR